ncbi:helix-turn-helix transcriptional regulator [Pseudomonadota bacterium]
MQIQPRLIRLRDAPAYLGIDKNKFNRLVRPALSEVSLGNQTILFDRLEIDAWAEDYIKRNGRRPLGLILEDDLCQSATKCRGSALKTGSGISKNARSTPPVAGSAKAQEYLAALRQSKN